MHDDLKQRLRDEVDARLGSRPSRNLPDVVSRGRNKRLALRFVTTVSMVLLGTGLVAGGLWIAGARSPSTERGSIKPADDHVRPSEPTPREPWTGPCADSQDGPPPMVCLGPLEEGTYASQRFEPALTFTVPAGWNNPWDTRGEFDLWTPGWSDGADRVDHPAIYLLDHPGLTLYRDVRAVEGCSDTVDTGTGTSALELATWVSDRPGVATDGPSPVEVGGLAGYKLDVSIAETWDKSCPGMSGFVRVGLFGPVSLVEEIGGAYGSWRLILLDLPDGGNVLISIDGEKVDIAMPVVRSFEFES